MGGKVPLIGTPAFQAIRSCEFVSFVVLPLSPWSLQRIPWLILFLARIIHEAPMK